MYVSISTARIVSVMSAPKRVGWRTGTVERDLSRRKLAENVTIVWYYSIDTLLVMIIYHGVIEL